MYPFLAAPAPGLDNGGAAAKNLMSSGPIDRQIREVEQTLERLNRDLDLAQARAQQQQQKIAESRRRLEQWRWVNAINEVDPETARLVAVSLATQVQVIDVAVKSNADLSTRIERLQNRIERQTARYFDLQSRRRAGGSERRRDSDAKTRSETPAHQPSAHGARPGPEEDAAASGDLPFLRRHGMNYSGYLVERHRF